MEIYRNLNGHLGTIPKASVIRASNYIVLTGNDAVDYMSILALENLRTLVANGGANDELKYAIPECWKVKLTSTFNARSLQNFLKLRSSKAALWEIRELANHLYSALPEDHKYLFTDCIGESDAH